MIVPFRQQAVNFWQKQTKPQRITLIVLVLAALIIVPILITWASQPSYAVVFSGLSETDAGQIVEKLKANNIPYQLKDSSTVMVPSSQVYEVRLMMASAGIPQSSTVGFEVFSNNTLGMTEFTQKVNYQRALEGELERTIGSLNSVESVRVHIVTPDKSLFTNDQQKPTASVTLKVKSGQRIDTNQVNAITHLVANSIEGLKAENVVLVDTNGKMLTSNTANNTELNTVTEADYHQQIEQQTAQDIQQKVQTMLDSVLGPNRSTVKASVAMDWSQVETTSQTFNPTPAAVRSSHTIDESYTLNGTTGGIPGASSNLPTLVPTVTVTGGNTLYQKKETTYNYELTQVQSKQVAAPGKIQRMTVSVMVDGITDAAQLNSLKNAAIAAAGIDTNRGDSIAMESMAFDRTAATETQAQEAQANQNDLYIRIGEIALGAVAILIMIIVVMRLFSGLRKSAGEQWKPVMRPVSEMALAAGMAAGGPAMIAGPTETAFPEIPDTTQSSTAEQVQNRIAEMMTRNVPSAEDEQLLKVLSQMTEESPATVAEIIQMWLNED